MFSVETYNRRTGTTAAKNKKKQKNRYYTI